MTAIDSDELALLRDAVEPGALRAALMRLASQYPGKALVANDMVSKAIARLGDETAHGDERLQTLLFLLDLRGKSKELAKPIEAASKRLLQAPLPPFASLADAQTQKVFAAFLSLRKVPWLSEYLARAAVSAPGNQKIRAILVAGLCRNAGTCSGVLAQLIGPLRELTTSPQIQDKEAMQRLRIILEALKTSVLKSALVVDAASAATLFELVSVAKGASFAGDRDAGERTWVGVHAAAVANVTAAKRPALLADRALAGAVVDALALTVSSRSAGAAKKQIEELTGRMASAVELCARQGAAARDVFFNLESLCGSREQALRITRGIAANMPGLREDLDRWLWEGELPTGQGESSASDDHAIAVLLLRVMEQQSEPAESRKAELASSVAVEALAVARKRGLEIAGSPGDEVPFDPLQHQLAAQGGGKGGKVRIVVPAVIKRRGDGKFSVILPAVVRAT
jgi:hypothetical protein